MLSELLDHYGWWLLGLLLIATEMVAPGYFLLWIGIAAAVMGVVTLLLPGLPFVLQTVVFAVLAVMICGIYWKYIRPRAELRDDQPLLNKRGERMIGRRVLVAQAIVNGRGKVSVGDGEWLAEGPDLPIGSEVEVVSIRGTTLQVRPLS